MPIFKQANIGRASTPAEARRNIERFFTAGPQGPTIAMLCEVDEGDPGNEHRMAKHATPGWGRMGWETTNPIVVDQPWEVQVEHVDRIHGGIPRVTPARKIVHGIVARGNLQIAVAGVHFLNGKDRNQRNADLWDESFEMLRDIADMYVSDGKPFVWAGDTNADGHMTRVHRSETRVYNAYNDFMGIVLPHAGFSARVVDVGKIPLTIDGHNGHWAQIEITAVTR